jgi:TRAP-type C4-dicarboxylate transport system permease small subunit
MEEKKTKFSGFFKAINKLEDIVLAILVIGMIVVIMLQIIGRVIGHPFPWTEESSRYLFLWMMFVSLAAGFNKCESSRVTLLVQVGPKWLKKFTELLYIIVVLGFFAFMFVYGMQVVEGQINLHEKGTALRIPMWIIGICQPVGAVLGFIGTIQSLIQFPERVAIKDKNTEKQKILENEQ